MPSTLPCRAGVGLKPEHYRTILAEAPAVGFFEVHAENYMGAGGPPHRYLSAIRERYPLSLHGVGLSIGADRPLDLAHLARLKTLIQRYEPSQFSEHLAWSSHGEVFLNDLLPLPYTDATLARIVAHVGQVQDALGQRLLLENPSTYVRFEESSWSEIDFLAEIARRSGCGLLLDVNNVFVSATNHGFAAEAYVDAFPLGEVGEIHLGGHAPEADEAGAVLLIDAHDRAVADPVWQLYGRVLQRTGPLPTLIEWDDQVPAWPELLAEARRANACLAAARPHRQPRETRRAAAG